MALSVGQKLCCGFILLLLSNCLEYVNVTSFSSVHTLESVKSILIQNEPLAQFRDIKSMLMLENPYPFSPFSSSPANKQNMFLHAIIILLRHETLCGRALTVFLLVLSCPILQVGVNSKILYKQVSEVTVTCGNQIVDAL